MEPGFAKMNQATPSERRLLRPLCTVLFGADQLCSARLWGVR